MIPVLPVIDLGVSSIPHVVFLVIHLAAFAIGATLAWKLLGRGGGARTMGWGFVLYAIAEISYMGYHIQPPATTFLFSHTLAEVLNLVAFITIFVGATQSVTSDRSTGASAPQAKA